MIHDSSWKTLISLYLNFTTKTVEKTTPGMPFYLLLPSLRGIPTLANEVNEAAMTSPMQSIYFSRDLVHIQSLSGAVVFVIFVLISKCQHQLVILNAFRFQFK